MSQQPQHNRADHVGALQRASKRFHRTRQQMVEHARQLDKELGETGHHDRQPDGETGGTSASAGN